MSETDDKEESWSDRLKRAIKPQWMVESDKRRAAGSDDWRPGHLAWLATFGSPAELDGFSQQVSNALTRKGHDPEPKWQERERNQSTNTSPSATSSPKR